MDWVALIISLVALVLSFAAIRRTGGLAEMRREVENLSTLGDSLRKKSADLLDRLEKKVRGEEKSGEKRTGEPPKEEGAGPKQEG